VTPELSQSRPLNLVIGIDGASFHWISKFSNHLPTFHEILSKSLWGTLTSVIPPTSPPAWSSILTGVNPSRHGVLNFYDIDSGEFTPIYTSKYPLLWDILEKYNLHSAFLWVPLTYPVQRYKKTIIMSGLPTPKLSYKAVNPMKLVHEFKHYLKILYSEDMSLTCLLNKIWARFKIVRQLIRRRHLDLVFFVIQETDSVWHIYNDECYAHRVYVEIDRQLNNFLNELENEGFDYNLLIVSDHGTSDVAFKGIFFNDLFRELRLLHLKKSVTKNKSKLFNNIGYNKIIQLLTSKLSLFLPFNLSAKAWVKFRVTSSSGIDFKKSFVYAAHGPTSRYVGLRVKHPRLKNIVNKVLMELRDSNGPIVEKIYDPEEIFSTIGGKYFDIIARLKSGYAAFETFSPFKLSIASIKKYIMHSLDGIYIAHGSSFNKGKKDLDILYIFPLILKLLKIPIPEYCEIKEKDLESMFDS